jgi:hypothetical protein
MALHQDGQVAEAKKTLAEAVLAYDWRAGSARDQDGWICHVLRREAETMILPELPASRSGQARARLRARRHAEVDFAPADQPAMIVGVAPLSGAAGPAGEAADSPPWRVDQP